MILCLVLLGGSLLSAAPALAGSCSYSSPQQVTCERFNDQGELQRWVLGTVRESSLPIGLTIKESTLDYVHSDTFKRRSYNIQRVTISDSTLTWLTNGGGGGVFAGLEQHLWTVQFTRSNFLTPFVWSHFRNLKNLVSLELESCRIPDVDGLDQLSNEKLKEVGIKGCGVHRLPPRAFANVADLESLRLDDNKISELARSMFPFPALKLELLTLRENRLRELPSNLFSKMPSLRRLDISDNQLSVLDEATFAPVWGDLRMLFGQGNLLGCDCKLSWILKNRRQDVALTCHSPRELKGQDIRRLTAADLVCY